MDQTNLPSSNHSHQYSETHARALEFKPLAKFDAWQSHKRCVGMFLMHLCPASKSIPMNSGSQTYMQVGYHVRSTDCKDVLRRSTVKSNLCISYQNNVCHVWLTFSPNALDHRSTGDFVAIAKIAL